MSSGNAAAATNGLPGLARGEVHDIVLSTDMIWLIACLLLI